MSRPILDGSGKRRRIAGNCSRDQDVAVPNGVIGKYYYLLPHPSPPHSSCLRDLTLFGISLCFTSESRALGGGLGRFQPALQ